MHKKILCAGMTLCFACAPSLSDGQGARCSETLACEDGFSCYRGFCLPDGQSPGDSSAEPAPIGEQDAGQAAGDGLVARPDAGEADAAEDTSAAEDAGAAPARATDAAVMDTPLAEPPDDEAADRKPAAKPKPNAPAPPPQGAPQPPDRNEPAVSDASVPADAAAPDAGVLSGKCTLKQCCEEALRAADEDDEERDEQKRGRECGCDDAQLIVSLRCDLL